MDLVKVVFQIIIALGIVNVWVLRFGKDTRWRGGEAKTLRDEFKAYGLPIWFMIVVGGLKLCLAGLLVAGIWIPPLTGPAATGMALLMLGAVVMHMKVKDPLRKALPAMIMLLLSLVVAFA